MPSAISDGEFARYFSPPMKNVSDSADGVLDIWPYVDQIPATEIGDLAPHDVEYVYRDSSDRYEHVLIATCLENRYLIIVLDRDAGTIVGHHFLDLNRLYGLDDEAPR